MRQSHACCCPAPAEGELPGGASKKVGVHGGPCVLRGCSLLCLLCPDSRVESLAFWNVLPLAKSIDLGCGVPPSRPVTQKHARTFGVPEGHYMAPSLWNGSGDVLNMSHEQEVVGYLPEGMQQSVGQVGMWNLPLASSVTWGGVLCLVLVPQSL